MPIQEGLQTWGRVGDFVSPYFSIYDTFNEAILLQLHGASTPACVDPQLSGYHYGEKLRLPPAYGAV